MFRANTQYEGDYLLGTSIARPLIAKRQIEIARQVGADAVRVARLAAPALPYVFYCGTMSETKRAELAALRAELGA